MPTVTNDLPSGLATLADHEHQARETLDEKTWAYLFGAAADELTHGRNLEAWRELALLPRVLRPLAGGHTRIELFGHERPHPILVAPMAYHRLAHPEGELATALAAAALGAGLVVSTQASCRLEDVAGTFLPGTDRGPLWFQLYLQPDRAFTRDLVRRAEAAGYEALVLTVDAPVQGARDRERRTGFRLPAGVRAVNLDGMRLPPSPTLGPTQSALFDDLLLHAPTWEDVSWLRSITRLPVLLKGVLHAEDAALAIEHGASGLIVSNHGGRTLDTAITTAAALPALAQTVQGRVPLLVDGGIRRGTDVLKAMALGASAVLVGRPVLHGLANAGAQGVAHVLRLLRDELEIAMALTGCRTLAEAGDALVRKPGR
ncbi:alpha-hydroxy acid oxidase [Hydrogenophaga sp.]|jgi:4-hydroxymandelate oxidase|uniref:alpha-hydroxy acid oxidase n=1 Tax=Hydrogenophaga sp. TaxID=1904254 RepID=UPI003F6F9E13